MTSIIKVDQIQNTAGQLLQTKQLFLLMMLPQVLYLTMEVILIQVQMHLLRP